MNAPRIGIFAHSTNPRGGVVHAMQLCEALCAIGHDATLLAPSVAGGRFAREPDCPVVLIPAAPITGTVEDLVETRRSEIGSFLRGSSAPAFDLLHAQDTINALALADLVQAGRISGFLRTVHHLDEFTNSRRAAWQDLGVSAARDLFCVSKLWRSAIEARYGRHAVCVGNGVDTGRFSAVPDPRDAALRRRLHIPDGRIVLVIGGIERRKNTVAITRAFFALLKDEGPSSDLHLVIAGGASLLDHSATQIEFDQVVRNHVAAAKIHVIGTVQDADMPALYRASAMLCFASLAEGFGLCVLEAMACGIPVIASLGAPYDEYLEPADAIRVDPRSDAQITASMRQALRPEAIEDAKTRGPRAAAAFSWAEVARAHLPHYERCAMELTEHA